jgi:hypothetical protein
MLLSHGWVIGSLFGSSRVSEHELDSFVRFGTAQPGPPEPRSAEVDERVAEALRTGKVRCD